MACDLCVKIDSFIVFGRSSYRCHEGFVFRSWASVFAAWQKLQENRSHTCKLTALKRHFYYQTYEKELPETRSGYIWCHAARFMCLDWQLCGFRHVKCETIGNQSSRVFSQESMKNKTHAVTDMLLMFDRIGSSTFSARHLETLKRELQRKVTNKLRCCFVKYRFHANPL